MYFTVSLCNLHNVLSMRTLDGCMGMSIVLVILMSGLLILKSSAVMYCGDEAHRCPFQGATSTQLSP